MSRPRLTRSFAVLVAVAAAGCGAGHHDRRAEPCLAMDLRPDAGARKFGAFQPERRGCRRCRVDEPGEWPMCAARSPGGRAPADVRSASTTRRGDGAGALTACSYGTSATWPVGGRRSLLGELVSQKDSVHPPDSVAG